MSEEEGEERHDKDEAENPSELREGIHSSIFTSLSSARALCEMRDFSFVARLTYATTNFRI